MSRETVTSQDTTGGSWLSSYFKLDEFATDRKTEIIAGITTFVTMSHIIVVAPTILGEGIALQGYSTGQVQQMLAVATIVIAAISTVIMAMYANRPFALAPSLGLMSYVVFTVMGTMGIPWQTALAAVVVEGILFVGMTAFGIRKLIIDLFPKPIKLSIGIGIGLYLAILGLQKMQIIKAASGESLVTLGSVASNPVALVAIFGLFLTFVLHARGTPGAILFSIVSTTVIAWAIAFLGIVPFETIVNYEPTSATYDITPLAGSFVGGFESIELVSFSLIVFTLLFVNFFDTAGTLIGVGQMGGFLDEDGNLPEIEKPLLVDAIGTTLSGIIGTTPMATYLESAAGVEEGGRTGLTALVVALLFVCALAAVPLIAMIPSYVPYIALVFIALLMLQNVTDIEWDDFTHAIPAGLTIMIMPLSFSIAYGVAAGAIAYPIVKIGAGEFGDIRLGHIGLALLFAGYIFLRTGGVMQSL